LGTAHGLARFVGAAVGTALMALVLNLLHYNGWLWLALLSLQLTIIAVPLVLIRWKWGLPLDHAADWPVSLADRQ
jgi:hypothetical protein